MVPASGHRRLHRTLARRSPGEHLHTVSTQLRDVALRCRVLHIWAVHRGHDEQRAIPRDAERGEQVVAIAVRELWR